MTVNQIMANEGGHKIFIFWNFILSYLTSGKKYEGWNFNSSNYLFTTDTK